MNAFERPIKAGIEQGYQCMSSEWQYGFISKREIYVGFYYN
jgi:hypothetical protein